MNQILQIRNLLNNSITIPQEKHARFFKVGEGHYAAHDKFLGVTVPTLRKIAKEFSTLTLEEIQELIQSPYNEERLLALFIMVNRYQKGSPAIKDEMYSFYLKNISHINNWNLVDSSAGHIIGAHEFSKNSNLLSTLSHSSNLWERRIAIIATLYFIKKSDLSLTFNLAQILLNDQEDLMHKAVGWMLREAGKKNELLLINFLDRHATTMPRTMLRYALEKFPENVRKSYLNKAQKS